jgi:hypothetical protein
VFAADYGTTWPEPVAKITDDHECCGLDVIGRPAAPYEGPLRGLTRPVRR